MTRVRTTMAIAAALSVAALAAAPAAAQEEMAAEGDVVEVIGVEYAYQGLPTELTVGTSLGFNNTGEEVHELAVARIADDVTESIDELLAMEAEGIDVMAEGLVELVGEGPLFAAPASVAEGTLPLEREGRYVAICFIPQGLTDASIMAELGPDTDPATLPPEVQEIMANPPHVALGMIQEFTVTAAAPAEEGATTAEG